MRKLMSMDQPANFSVYLSENGEDSRSRSNANRVGGTIAPLKYFFLLCPSAIALNAVSLAYDDKSRLAFKA